MIICIVTRIIRRVTRMVRKVTQIVRIFARIVFPTFLIKIKWQNNCKIIEIGTFLKN